MAEPLFPESDRLDKYLRKIKHNCTTYCKPPLHYEVIGMRRGPLIEPPVDKIEYLLMMIIILTAMVVIITQCNPFIVDPGRGRCLCGSRMAKLPVGGLEIAACEDDGCLMRDNSYATATHDAQSARPMEGR